MEDRRVRNARMCVNVGHAIHDPRSPVRPEVTAHTNVGVTMVKETREAYLKRMQGAK